jgi:hypothetical protein
MRKTLTVSVFRRRSAAIVPGLDTVMPGSAERIVITGTSGGGGLSVAVAASGNSPDYYPYLAEIGAAGIDANGKSSIRDDVFATVAQLCVEILQMPATSEFPCHFSSGWLA